MVIALIVAGMLIPAGILLALYSRDILYWCTKMSTRAFVKLLPDLMEHFSLDEESVMRLTEKSWLTKIVVISWRISGVILSILSIFAIFYIVILLRIK
jgi:hypothetical protein